MQKFGLYIKWRRWDPGGSVFTIERGSASLESGSSIVINLQLLEGINQGAAWPYIPLSWFDSLLEKYNVRMGPRKN